MWAHLAWLTMTSQGKEILPRIWAVVLGLTALLKLLDMVGPDPYYDEHDRLLHLLTRRQVTLLAVVFEGGVAVWLWTAVSNRRSGLVLAWFCAIVITYKLGLSLTLETRRCSCLGVLGKLLALSGSQLETLTWCLLILMAGSSMWLLFQRTQPGAARGVRTRTGIAEV